MVPLTQPAQPSSPGAASFTASSSMSLTAMSVDTSMLRVLLEYLGYFRWAMFALK